MGALFLWGRLCYVDALRKNSSEFKSPPPASFAFHLDNVWRIEKGKGGRAVAWAKWAGERECLQFIQGLPSPHHTFPHHMNNGGGGRRRTKPISSPPPPPLCYWFYYCTHTGEGGAVGRLEFFLLSSYSQGLTCRRLKSRGICGGNYEKGTSTPWVWGKWMNDPYGIAGKCGRELIDRITFRIDFVQNDCSPRFVTPCCGLWKLHKWTMRKQYVVDICQKLFYFGGVNSFNQINRPLY